jgi:hypothetical protein
MCDDIKVKICGREYVANVDDYTTPPEPAPDKMGSNVTQDKPDFTKEHQTIVSRTTGKPCEIGFGSLPGGLVPANPFASLAQEGYLHAHPEKLGKKGLAEWDAATKGKSLPEYVKKSK